MQRPWLAAAAGRAEAQRAQRPEVDASLALWQYALARRAALALADDAEEDLFYARGEERVALQDQLVSRGRWAERCQGPRVCALSFRARGECTAGAPVDPYLSITLSLAVCHTRGRARWLRRSWRP